MTGRMQKQIKFLQLTSESAEYLQLAEMVAEMALQCGISEHGFKTNFRKGFDSLLGPADCFTFTQRMYSRHISESHNWHKSPPNAYPAEPTWQKLLAYNDGHGFVAILLGVLENDVKSRADQYSDDAWEKVKIYKHFVSAIEAAMVARKLTLKS